MNIRTLLLLLAIIPLAGCDSCRHTCCNHASQAPAALCNLDDATVHVIDLIYHHKLGTVLPDADSRHIDMLTKNVSPAEIAFEAEVLTCSTPVVLYFFDNTIVDHVNTMNMLATFALRFANQVKFVIVNTQTLSKIAQKAEIDQLPTWMFVKDRNEITRLQGSITQEQLEENITHVLAEEDND
jgi:hypothetical protein